MYVCEGIRLVVEGMVRVGKPSIPMNTWQNTLSAERGP